MQTLFAGGKNVNHLPQMNVQPYFSWFERGSECYPSQRAIKASKWAREAGISFHFKCYFEMLDLDKSEIIDFKVCKCYLTQSLI